MRIPLLILFLVLAAACGATDNANNTSSPCTPGTSAPCACSNGMSGAQVCGNDNRYGACACNGVTGDVSANAEPGGSADGGSGDASITTTEPGGPTFLSFGTNVTAITEGESVTFTTVVSHPQGTDALAGGSLVSADGTIQYGPFSTQGAQKGAYSITLGWSVINQAKTIEFTTEEQRVFVAQFFDTQGHKATKTVPIRLHCKGAIACSGRCGIDLKVDSNNCGKCGHTCSSSNGFGSDCRKSQCVGEVWSEKRATCSTTCALVNGGRCDVTGGCPLGDSEGHALYNGTWLPIKTCTDTPPATTTASISFSSMTCCCLFP